MESSVKNAPSPGLLPDSDKLPQELSQQAQLRERVKEALKQIEEGQAKHIHPQEPEARRMGVEGRNRFGYNAQATVDAQERIIVAADVVNDPNDQRQLNRMIEQAEEITEQSCKQTLADGGYSNGEQIAEAQSQGREIIMPLPSPSKNTDGSAYHSSHFKHDPERDVVVCPQGRSIHYQRTRVRRGTSLKVYRSASVCRDCPVRKHCTRDRHGRTIEISPWHTQVERHRSKMEQEEAQTLYPDRAHTIEPVFGWIKHNDGLRRWSYRGMDKVLTQWNMLCAAVNLRKIYQIWLAEA